MHESLGQFVLNGKPTLSYDLCKGLADNFAMPNDLTASAFKEQFIARTKQAREARYTQQQMAAILEMPQDKYKTYETRSFLPYRHIERFCIACGVTPAWLFSRQEMPTARPTRQQRRRTAA